MSSKKVVVGMSGGVDSSVAACLLKEQGYEVIGVTMQIWQTEEEYRQAAEKGCGSIAAVEDARLVAETLDIPWQVMNFHEIFREKVMDHFVEEYLKGRTPNPCIVCNRYVKWEALLARAGELGADYIATGHYARIEQLPNGRFAVRNSVTAAKDQTYALYQLTQEQLAHTLMPIGGYTKDEIRKIAADRGLPVAEKSDSQDICFIPDHDHAAFIERSTGRKMNEGYFVAEDGKILGKHKGIGHYTIGQRRGLGLPMGRRVFVKEIRPASNEVVIGEGEEVFGTVCKAREINFMGVPEMAVGESGSFTAKIRYGHRGAPCTVTRTGEDELTFVFEQPVRAATPGQSVVFYQEDHVAGGGVIL